MGEEAIKRVIESLRAGEQEAFATLYDETIEEVYRTVHFLVADKADIDDVVQEVYMQLHRSLDDFQMERSFRPWLIGMTIRQVKSYRRRRWMHFRKMYKEMTYKEKQLEPDFSERVLQRLANKELLKQISKLSFKQKEVVILRYFNDYSQEEVASILGIPVGTVKSRINSALKKLREKPQIAMASLTVQKTMGEE